MAIENPTMPAVNLSPDAVQERSLRSLYSIKSSEFVYASDEYMANRPNETRPLQWKITWVGQDFRFSNNPDTPPEIQRSINLTDKNGAVMTWGTKDPEPSDKDAFPVQLSKCFARLGIVVENDPHVLDGMWFWAEQRELTAGKATVTTLVPVERCLDKSYKGDLRIVTVSGERGQAGHPATGQPTAPTVSQDDAAAALAKAMNGKAKGDVITVAMSDDIVKQSAEVLSKVAVGDLSVLDGLGTWAGDIFVAA